MTTPPARLGPGGYAVRMAGSMLSLILLITACGGDDEPVPTFEGLLTELEGRALTPAEIAERAEVGETLCRLDDQVLAGVWQELDEGQLAFQDIVVALLCPERAVFYAASTGRAVTEEAELSGVATTSTTRRLTATSNTTPTNNPNTSSDAPSSTPATASESTTTQATPIQPTSTDATATSTQSTLSAPTSTASTEPTGS